MRAAKILIVIILAAIVQEGFSQEKITLRLVDWAGLDELPGDIEAIANFKQLHPGIEVLYEPNPGRVYEEKLLTGIAAGEPPDVFLLDSKLIPTFTNKKILLDLSPFIEQLNIDTSQWFPNVLSIARRGSGLYAFPKGFTPLMMYFNKKLFRESGIPYPEPNWTWSEFFEISRQLTKDFDGDGTSDQYGTAFTNYYYLWIPWIWSAGGDVVSPGGERATGYLNTPGVENALQVLIDLRTKFGVAPDVGSWIQAEKTGANPALFAGARIAMIADGHWRLPTYLKYMRENSLDIGVAPLPRQQGRPRVNILYESGWCVPVSAPHPREAALLAAFMAGETACRIRSINRLEIPSNRKVAAEFIRNDSTGMEAVFIDEVPFCRQPWGSVVERFSEIEWTLQDAVDEVMIGRKPMHETMTAYAARVDKELDNIRSHASFEFKPIREHSEILYFLFGVSGVVVAGCGGLYTLAKRRSRRTLGSAFVFLAPSLFHLIVFVFTPIVFAAYLSVHRWDVVVPDRPFVGAANFAEMVGDPGFWTALRNTFTFSLNVPAGMAISLAVAFMLHKRVKAPGVLRTLYFLPGVTSFVAIALVWMWIYHPSFGAANYLLGVVGLPPLQWLNSATTAMMSIIIFSVWLGIGYQMVVFLAGLQGIPQELYDAARVDGASGWQNFRRITIPLLMPTTLFVLVTSLIGSFQVFTTIYVMTAGGPVRSTDVIVYHIYQAAWEQLRMGYASAMSWVLFVIIMIATWIQFKVMGREVEYS
jgi:multiple sugar transport system permease protein